MTDQGLQITKLQPHFNQRDPQGDRVSRQLCRKEAAKEIAQLCSQLEETFGKLELM